MAKKFFFLGTIHSATADGKAEDGHTRITKSDDFIISGGSKDEHEMKVEQITKVAEKLQKVGDKICPQAIEDAYCEVIESQF